MVLADRASVVDRENVSTIEPGATLAVIGGGQLGRMFVHAAQRMGYRSVVLDPDQDSPAGQVSELHIVADYANADCLEKLSKLAHAVTTEFENVPAQSLDLLEETRFVAPAGDAVAIAQDRILEKEFFGSCGIACAPYAVIETEDQLEGVDQHLFPGILKTARLGYDGKGQRPVSTRAELVQAWREGGKSRCVLEKRLPLAFECSVILARGRDGETVIFPVQRNLHRHGVLVSTEVHADAVPHETAQRARAAAQAVAGKLHYVGVLCVEFFVLADDSLLANEMAPRPHNSGHYTINACDVSQFDLQVRVLAGLPLVQPQLLGPAVMLNLLGDLWFAAGNAIGPQEPRWVNVLCLPGVSLHLYGKAVPRPGRKMGHLTIVRPTWDAVQEVAAKVLIALKV